MLMLGLAMNACSPEPVTRGPPAPPPGARPSVEEGPQEERLDEVVLQLRNAVQDPARPLQIATYRLPAGAGWAAVSAHYDTAVGWPRDRRVADHIRGAQARAWRGEGRVVAIALIDTPTPGMADAEPLLVVATPD